MGGRAEVFMNFGGHQVGILSKKVILFVHNYTYFIFVMCKFQSNNKKVYAIWRINSEYGQLVDDFALSSFFCL